MGACMSFVSSERVVHTLLEMRAGEKSGHRFHGNQWGGGRARGRAGGDEPSGAGPTSPAPKLSRKQAVESLRANGYTGPVSFSVTRLNEIHSAHMATQGHPPVAGAGVAPPRPSPAPAPASPKAAQPKPPKAARATGER